MNSLYFLDFLIRFIFMFSLQKLRLLLFLSHDLHNLSNLIHVPWYHNVHLKKYLWRQTKGWWCKNTPTPPILIGLTFMLQKYNATSCIRAKYKNTKLSIFYFNCQHFLFVYIAQQKSAGFIKKMLWIFKI